ncbi:CaiB/BaiF CoA-transferase family protein [Candidatus Njordibacter sp. Uisw_039]|jgi:crotonobetainyl-CoA:carnitine CoA-transferase CaiB-like acyl-CoA transferase|uniref:CaiB/BaiF CoA transferase family protein n=1 Tax=Candidatus Njordibacter sp. Uisw_039 TaxID=3230972 RepID=UPI003D3E8D1C
MKPLLGYRVLDLSNVLSGPFCGCQLAHLGAEVIKIEVPNRGDLARQLGLDVELNQKLMGATFLAQNSGKRSITINLKSEEGVAVFKRLVKTADVIVENFRPGVMDRLGVGYEALKDLNADLVYCAISGFGQEGPLKSRPAYDQIIQGMSGTMSITGDVETAPLRVGFPIADTIGGMTAAFAISAALAKQDGKRGTFIDVSMLESVMCTMGFQISNYFNANQEPQPMGNENFSSSPSGTFRTGSGQINIAANKQEQFEATCQVLDLNELCENPKFATRESRLENRGELSEILNLALVTRSTDEWVVLLNEAGVPCGPILTVAEALAQPQIADRGMVATYTDVPGVNRDIQVTRTGIKLDGKTPSVDTPPPMLGEHTDDILGELGLTTSEIKTLKEGKVI